MILLDVTRKTIEKDRAEGRDPIANLVAAYVSDEPAEIVNEMNRQLEEMPLGIPFLSHAQPLTKSLPSP